MEKMTRQLSAQKTGQALRILIFTGRFGMGHCAAAQALQQEILVEQPDADVRIVDVIDYLFPEASARIYDAFSFLVKRCSWVYNLLNRAVSTRMGTPLQGAVIKKMDVLLAEADLVIATMPVCSQYISAYKRQRSRSVPLYTYITDVTVHDEWIAEGTDLYFTAAACTRDCLIARGVEPERVLVSGIPVRQTFLQLRETAHDGKHVLIMGGGLGLIPEADALLKALSARPDLHVTLIAGRNETLLRRVRDQYPAVEAVGYTGRVSDYMQRADLIVTKSGGITTFEAIHSRTPMYILRPFLTQEVGNAHYIEQQGIGRIGWQKDPRATVNEVTALLDDHRLHEQMRANMRRIQKRWVSTSPLAYFHAVTELCG